TGKEVRRWQIPKVPGPVAFSSDGRRALHAADRHSLVLWDLEKDKLLCSLAGHTSAVRRVVFSADGRRALSCGADSTLRLWDLESGKEWHGLPGASHEEPRGAFSPDGKTLAHTGPNPSTVCLWDADTGKELRSLHTHGAKGLSFTPDGRRILTSGMD